MHTSSSHQTRIALFGDVAFRSGTGHLTATDIEGQRLCHLRVRFLDELSVSISAVDTAFQIKALAVFALRKHDTWLKRKRVRHTRLKVEEAVHVLHFLQHPQA
jgi:hypothetical protein